MNTHEHLSSPGTDEVQPAKGGMHSPRVAECRRLVANRYLDEGYIGASDVDSETGYINQTIDPYYSHSEYFWTLDENDAVQSTIRVINHPLYQDDEWRFPLQREFDIDPVSQEYIDYFNKHDPELVVEVSGLAERRGADQYAAFDLYRRFWQHAKRSDYAVCLISADERLHKKLVALFGDAIHQVGDSRYVMGSDTVPSILSPGQCIKAMCDVYEQKLLEEGPQAADAYRAVFEYLINGLEPRYFTNDEKYCAFRMGVELTK